MVKKDPTVEKSFIVPLVEGLLKAFSCASAFRLITWAMTKRWAHYERVPFWFAELYVVGFLLVLSVLFFCVPARTTAWYLCDVFAGYRLFDLAQGLASIIVFEPQVRRDEQGGYILARNTTRWLFLTLINLGEIIVCFAFFYFTWGNWFSPAISTRISAIYQSTSVFIGGSGAPPTSDITQAVVVINLGYFVFFLAFIAPLVFSLIRAKERTTEELGHPDAHEKS